MSPTPADAPTFEWVGGCLILDFVNTVSWGDREDPNDRLPDYPALVGWAVDAGIVADAAGRRLRTRAAEHPAAGRRALRRARGLRASGYAIFSAIAAGIPVTGEDLEAFNGFLEGVPLRIAAGRAHEFRWEWPGSGPDAPLDALLHPVIWSGTEVLLDPEVRGRIKGCANHRCGWLFVDVSRRGNRRWCDMRDCGNRAKARRYYRRHRAGS